MHDSFTSYQSCCMQHHQQLYFLYFLNDTAASNNYTLSLHDALPIFKITDDRLLNKTGGIEQGMSGSPIIQDGKLVGAVTHVFVNDPTSGYGVHIEWMLQEAGIHT